MTDTTARNWAPGGARGRSRGAALAAAIASLLVLTACSGGSNAVDQSAGDSFRYVQSTPTGSLIAPAKRKAAGAVTGTLMTGQPYRLAQDHGQVVVMNYFAHWCAPCQVETPQFDGIYRARKGTDVTFLGVDAKDSPQGAAQAWIADKGITFPVLYDLNAKTALQLGRIPIVTLPATVLIDKAGRVAAVYQGTLAPADLNPVLDTLAAET
jgi:peroxiredoxin